MELIPLSTLPETGFLRLPHIVGNPKARSTCPSPDPGVEKHLVGRRQIRPLSPADQTRAQDYRLAGRGYSPTYPKEISIILLGMRVTPMEWVKIMCNILDNRKIKMIRSGPEGNTLFLLWLLMLTEAGKCNRGGYLMIADNLPYTEETLNILTGISPCQQSASASLPLPNWT